MNCSTPGLPVHHQLLEFTQTHVHRVGDAIRPSHPLSSPSPPAPNPSQHHSLFQWVNSSHEVAKVFNHLLLTKHCLSAMQETRVRSLGWEDPLDKEIAAHSNILTWKIPWTMEPGRLLSMGSQRVGHDWVISLSLLNTVLRTLHVLYHWSLTTVLCHSSYCYPDLIDEETDTQKLSV